jgi:hypothetical protein
MLRCIGPDENVRRTLLWIIFAEAMINTPTHIFTAKIQTVKGIHDVLRLMTCEQQLELYQVYPMIQQHQQYHVIHNINSPRNINKQYQVQGDSLVIFIQDYIEPGLGDGLDMYVFPENGEWCMVFDVDGNILLKS